MIGNWPTNDLEEQPRTSLPVEVYDLAETVRRIGYLRAGMVPGSSMAATLEDLAETIDAYRSIAWIEVDDPEIPGAVTIAYGDDLKPSERIRILAPDPYRGDNQR